MTKKNFPDIVHALFLTWFLNEEADKFLRDIINLSKNSEIYTHDSIIAGYASIALLNFDFLEPSIFLRYTMTGLTFENEYQLERITPSQCILYDLGNYTEDMNVPNNYTAETILKTEQLTLPMVYFVYSKKDIRLDVLKSKIHVATPENVMVYDRSEPES
jgi:hypothetical protein